MGISAHDFLLKPSELRLYQTQQAEKRLGEFVRQAWHVVEPSRSYIPNWHLDAISEHLEACSAGQIQRLLINVPPGAAKSIMACVMWQAWEWTTKPQLRYIFGSYKEDFAFRDAIKTRSLITSDWYKERWGHKYELVSGENAAGRYNNSKTGYRISAGVTSGIGERGDRISWDDPLSPDSADSEKMRPEVCERWRDTMSTRANDAKTAVWLIIMQRLHESDPCGDMLSEPDYYHLCLPMRYDGQRSKTCLQFRDPRTKEGELLFPARWDEKEVARLERMLGPYGTSAQLQQNPSPSGGGILKQWWVRYWKHPGQDLPPVKVRMPDGTTEDVSAVELPKITDKYQSWDMTFKDLKTSDYVVGQVWGKNGADRFLLDQVRERLDFPSAKQAVRDMSEKHPTAMLKLIEDKANGTAIMAELTHDIAGFAPVNPDLSKVGRAMAITPQMSSHNVYFPHPQNAEWISINLKEMTMFPNGTHDDTVDTMTQALSKSQKARMIFPMDVNEMLVQPFDIPVTWPRAFAIMSNLGMTGVVWGAWDKDNNIVYFYAEYMRQISDIAIHAETIKKKGVWIPGMMSASTSRNVAEREQIIRKYRVNGLKVSEVPGTDAAIQETWAAMQAGEIKVFSTITKWVEQFRLFRTNDHGAIVPENSQLQMCGCSLYGERKRMAVESRPKGVVEPNFTAQGWMS